MKRHCDEILALAILSGDEASEHRKNNIIKLVNDEEITRYADLTLNIPRIGIIIGFNAFGNPILNNGNNVWICKMDDCVPAVKIYNNKGLDNVHPRLFKLDLSKHCDDVWDEPHKWIGLYVVDRSNRSYVNFGRLKAVFGKTALLEYDGVEWIANMKLCDVIIENDFDPNKQNSESPTCGYMFRTYMEKSNIKNGGSIMSNAKEKEESIKKVLDDQKKNGSPILPDGPEIEAYRMGALIDKGMDGKPVSDGGESKNTLDHDRVMCAADCVKCSASCLDRRAPFADNSTFDDSCEEERDMTEDELLSMVNDPPSSDEDPCCEGCPDCDCRENISTAMIMDQINFVESLIMRRYEDVLTNKDKGTGTSFIGFMPDVNSTYHQKLFDINSRLKTLVYDLENKMNYSPK